MIYFIHSNAKNAIKIGVTKDVRGRVAALQTGNPEPLLLLASIEGNRSKEADLHRRFSHLRVHGEWFECTAELMIAIDDLTGGELWQHTMYLRDEIEDGEFAQQDIPHF